MSNYMLLCIIILYTLVYLITYSRILTCLFLVFNIYFENPKSYTFKYDYFKIHINKCKFIILISTFII